jgi:hypothetical protein
MMADSHGGSWSGLTRAALHRGLHYLIPNAKEKGRGSGTHRSLQLAKDTAERKEGVGGANGTGELLKGENEKGGDGGRERGRRGGDGVFPPTAELMVERAR